MRNFNDSSSTDRAITMTKPETFIKHYINSKPFKQKIRCTKANRKGRTLNINLSIGL
jgi:hypothetical protein